MGLGIQLQDELGNEIVSATDPVNLLARILPPLDDQSYPMLASIDPYGDTTFNRVQMPRFLAEWSLIAVKAQSPEESALVGEVANMARRCADEVHLYLKFIGD
jgi:hypothetical protein